MVRFFSFILFLNTISLSYGQDSTFNWVRQIGGKSYETAGDITADYQGNIYISALFSDTAYYTTNIQNPLISVGDNDIIIQKLDANGNSIWTNHIGSEGNDGEAKLAITKGGIYAAANFSNTIDFDPSSDTLQLTATGFSDIFIEKLDFKGNLIWAKSFGGSYAAVQSITTDYLGDLYISGYFGGTLDFDPGPGTHSLTSTGLEDVYIVKLDSNGVFKWAQQFNAVSSYMETDINGNLYVSGVFEDTLVIGIDTAISKGDNDIFIFKENHQGELVWLNQLGGKLRDNVNNIELDFNNNVYFSGHFADTINFYQDSVEINLFSKGDNDIFIQKVDSLGSLVWVKQIGGIGSDMAYDMDINKNNELLITGFYRHTVDFNPDTGEYLLNASGIEANTFIQKLDLNGNLIWVLDNKGPESNYGYKIDSDTCNNIYLLGDFFGITDFNPNSNVSESITSSGFSDVFIQKFNDCIIEQNNTNISEKTLSMFQVIPNPNNGYFEVKGNKYREPISIYNSLGKLILQSKTDLNINISNLNNGIYYIRNNKFESVNFFKN